MTRGEVRVSVAAALAVVGFAGVVAVFVFASRPTDAPKPQPTSPAPAPRPGDWKLTWDTPPPEQLSILVDLHAWDAATADARRAAAQDVAAREPDFTLLRLETFSCGGQTHEVAIYSHTKTGLEFVLVPGGTFVMGSPESEPHHWTDEAQHSVTLTRPFLIARTDCTQAAYEKVVGSNPSRFKGAALPVETVSWDDTTAFCAKAALELPTEAQWEYACRAGTTSTYCFGDDLVRLREWAWYDWNAGGTTHPVGQRKPNAFGLFDVHGNVWQWCADACEAFWWAHTTDHPAGRVIRGGSWYYNAESARSAIRDGYPPGERKDIVGFRPAKTVAP